MKILSLIAAISCLSFISCNRHGERVEIDETRQLTTKDITEPKLFATSDERFKDAKLSPVMGNAPENWLALPATQFRLLNYRFGESGISEVYVSLSSGGVRENVNRWLNQFGAEPMSPVDFGGMESVTIAGAEGVWVEATGEYGSGMGADAKPGYGLAGVIAEVGQGIITVKMLGPESEVEAEKQRLRDFVASLKMAEQ